MNKKQKIGAIILAAGKGKRMSSSVQNKVTLRLNNKPLILYGVELLKKLKIEQVIAVIGFAKESVIKILGNRVTYVVQEERLGTGNAVTCAFKKIPEDLTDILIINGDDCAFYTKDLLQKLIKKHYDSNSQVTFLTIIKDNPIGLGRVIRNKNNKVLSIIEEKEATDLQRKIKEIYPSFHIFKVSFLKKYLKEIKKSKVTNEYYLTDLINIAVENKEKIQDVPAGKIPWRGINTKKELLEANKIFQK